jgi:hypothetical protein
MSGLFVVVKDKKFLTNHGMTKWWFVNSLELAHQFTDLDKAIDHARAHTNEDSALSKDYAEVGDLEGFQSFENDKDTETGETIGNVMKNEDGKFITQCSHYTMPMDREELFFYYLNQYNLL